MTAKNIFTMTDDGKAITKQIKSISNRLGNVRRDLAIVAANVIIHAVKHGNVTPATQLCDALEGMRVNDLRQWFIDFGPMIWVEKEVQTEDGKVKTVKQFGLDKDKVKELAKRDTAELATELRDNPFWIVKKEAAFKPFSLKAELNKLAKRAAARAKKADERDDLDGLHNLQAYIAGVAVQAEAIN